MNSVLSAPQPLPRPTPGHPETPGVARTFTYETEQEVVSDPGVKCHVPAQSPEIC